ncbi:MAG: hypothetical protein J2P28_03025 [Actinobacteria bacterium]|nr:hypothetical protein [Actinomycetota bacterium]
MTTSAADAFLRGVWRRMQSCADDAVAGALATELRRQGASDDTVRQFVRSALAHLASDLAYFIGMPEGSYWHELPHKDVSSDDPRWQLVEVRPDGSLTGQTIVGLHEIFLQADPSGTEGADFGLS